jgi:CsoR family transcriptional regulator, copper-sensing transcriptional repressor
MLSGHGPALSWRWAGIPHMAGSSRDLAQVEDMAHQHETTTPRRGPATARGYEKDRAQVLRRLARMEGQVRGIARMIERDEYCIDILQQTAALRAAVDAVSLLLMEDHVAGCLVTAVKTGDAAAYTEEVMEVVRRSMGRPVRSGRSSTES